MRKKPGFRNEKGQSLVEFAIVVPVLLLLVMGIIEFGWLFNGQITLTSAAREGARAGMVGGLSDELRHERIKNAIKDHVEGLSGFTFDKEAEYLVTMQGFEDELGTNRVRAVGLFEEGDDKTITVHIRGKMEPLVGLLVPGPRDLRSSAVMRVE